MFTVDEKYFRRDVEAASQANGATTSCQVNPTAGLRRAK